MPNAIRQGHLLDRRRPGGCMPAMGRVVKVAGMAILLVAASSGCGTPFHAYEQSVLTAAVPARSLIVVGDVGNVTVQADPNATEVTAEVRRIGKGSSPAEAKRALEELEATLSPDPNEKGVLLAWSKLPPFSVARRYEVTWRLTCPPGLAVEVHNQIGDVTVRGVTGGLRVESSIGDIEAEAGGRVNILCDIGDVKLELLPGPSEPVVVASDIGDIHLALPLDRTGRLIADTDLGSLRVRLEGMMLQVLRQRSHHFEAQFGQSSEPVIDLTSDIGDISLDSYKSEHGTTASDSLPGDPPADR